MRIVSGDYTRNFPYDKTAFTLSISEIDGKEIYVLTAIFEGNNYNIGYYDDMQFAQEVMAEIACSPESIEVEDENGEIYFKENYYIIVPVNNFDKDC